MSDKPKNPAVGCLFNAMRVTVQVPMFAALLYGILDASQAPVWVWVLYWGYIPICFVFGLLSGVAESIAQE